MQKCNYELNQIHEKIQGSGMQVTFEDIKSKNNGDEYIKIVENCIWLLGNISTNNKIVAKRIVVDFKCFRIIG